jgi:hypothetical protein
MASTYPDIALSSDLQSLLAGLRWRIRLYIWAEGIALALIWFGVMFWFGLALDYLPVLMGASEMPNAPRAVLLIANGIALAYILYRWIGRRIFVPLGDRSLALVLERRFNDFNDSLVTAVEMADLPDHASAFNRELLASTTAEARAEADGVRYRDVFNKSSLATKVVAAIIVCASLAAFMATKTEAFDQAFQRLYLLSDEPWPRAAKIEVVGIEVLRNDFGDDQGPRSTALEFTDRTLKIARGANVSLKVRAYQPPEARHVPQQCRIEYRTQNSGAGVRGERGSVNMNNFRDTDDFRNFWFDGKPFKGVLSTIEFDVVGYDYRAASYKLEVVDSPAVVQTLLDIVSPKYMVDEATSSHLPITNQPYLPSGTFIPVGAQITVKFKSNKPLKRAEIRSSDGQDTTTVEILGTAKDAQQFAYLVDNLKASTTLEIALVDTDNVITERPHRVFLTAIEDQPPHIDVALKGIGSAVTPDVMIPFRGRVVDDYGVAKAWCDVQVDDRGNETERPLDLRAGGTVEQALDFRNERTEKTNLALAPGNKVLLAVKAADKFDLAGEPHVSTGERYELLVVTPEDLLARLEVREIGLRRRFELIIDEMTQMRDSLLRLRASLSSPDSASDDPRSDLDLDAKQLTPEQREQRAAELRQLRVQRAIQQSQKSLAEVQGVAAGFLSIREELINNRVDTADRKNRLKEQIADPLNRTCSDQFPRLDASLAALEGQLTTAGAKPALEVTATAADQSIDQTNTVLSELEAVLSKMQDLETYNELLDIVRDLLKDQQKLIERTQQERKRQTLEELKKLE